MYVGWKPNLMDYFITYYILALVLFERGCSEIRGCDESLIHLTCFNSFAIPSLHRVTER